MPKRMRVYTPPHIAGPARRPARLAPGERARVQDKAFYKLPRWRSLRALKLHTDPLCEVCQRANQITPAQHVHHLKPRKSHPELAFDFDNLESICIPCHNAKVER